MRTLRHPARADTKLVKPIRKAPSSKLSQEPVNHKTSASPPPPAGRGCNPRYSRQHPFLPLRLSIASPQSFSGSVCFLHCFYFELLSGLFVGTKDKSNRDPAVHSFQLHPQTRSWKTSCLDAMQHEYRTRMAPLFCIHPRWKWSMFATGANSSLYAFLHNIRWERYNSSFEFSRLSRSRVLESGTALSTNVGLSRL